jgi:hypothetical protein
MIEVGDVARSITAPADLDRLPEGIEEPVAERVAHVCVVETAGLPGLVGKVGELGGRRVGARRVVETR